MAGGRSRRSFLVLRARNTVFGDPTTVRQATDSRAGHHRPSARSGGFGLAKSDPARPRSLTQPSVQLAQQSRPWGRRPRGANLRLTELPTSACVRHGSIPSTWKPDPRSLLAFQLRYEHCTQAGWGCWRSIGRILPLGARSLLRAVDQHRPFSQRAPPRCRPIRIVAGGERDQGTISR